MSTTSTVAREQRKSFGGLAITAIVLSVLLAGLVVFSGFWTDIQWFAQLNAVRVFWIQWGWAIALGVIGTTFVTLSVAINLIVTHTPSGGLQDYRKQADAHPWLVRFGASVVIGLVFGASLSREWRTYVLWLHRTPFGSSDAEFGRDISFYVFTLPVLQSLLWLAVTTLAVSGVVAVIGHYVYGGIHMKEGRLALSRKARIHFGVLGALAALIMGAYLWLSRYGVLLQDNERFSGANFTAVKAGIPGREILAIAAFLVAVLFVLAAVKGVWKLVTIGVAVSVVAGLVLGSAYPYLVQRFQVQPNAVEMESEYIQRNINATLEAYGLDEVETSQYSAETEAGAGQLRADAETTAQIRVLDPNVVSPTFTQLQRNRTYYSFADQLSVDRYTINGKARDTVIAVRELNLEGLNNDQRTWVNDHTVYTHGYGVVAAYGNTTTEDGTPHFFQQGIPSTGELGEYEPRVYFGLKSPKYSVVGAPEGTNPWELDYTTDGEKSGQVSTTFTGNGGPSIGSTFAKLMFAIKFRDTDLFFSDRVTSSSQILYDRDPRDRVAKIAPYLTLDSRVYPAVVDMDGDSSTPNRLVWIIDGYTTTNEYPYSARQSLKEATEAYESPSGESFAERPEQVNYIRNSVKAVVDAYDGSVALYQWDKKDPIVNAWKAVFPGMLKDVSDMSGDLMSHMRYPEDLFKVQRTLLARYHVKDAAEFYSGSDFWDIPQEPTASSGSRMKQPPYYLTLQMPGQESAEFSISSSYILSGGQNVMTGFVAVDSEAGNEPGKIREGYGKIRMLELPRDVTYPGPGQAENNFLTESTVSTTLNLLKQGGTTVTMGNLLTLPVGGGLLYVQPVYVRTSASGGGTSYPISQYVLTTFGSGSKIGFAPTLEESLNKIFSGDSGATAGDADVSGDKDATITNGNGATSNTGGAEATPSPSPSAGTDAPSAGDARERLDTALKNAQSALTESNTAMKNGDWAAYGEAQKKLQQALEQAVAAREEVNKAAG